MPRQPEMSRDSSCIRESRIPRRLRSVSFSTKRRATLFREWAYALMTLRTVSSSIWRLYERSRT